MMWLYDIRELRLFLLLITYLYVTIPSGQIDWLWEILR
jgi:hypothetical protein